jgi:D-alanyl-D-alanine dipeptidase
MKEELNNSIKKKILRQSERTAESPGAEEKPNFLKIINTFAKSMVSLPSFARDLNVARQNLVWLIKLKGGKPTNKADAFFLKADEREAKFEVDMAKQKSEDETGSSPTPEKKTDDKKDPLERIMTSILDIFGLGALGKYFAVGKILGSLKIIGITFLLTTIASGLYKGFQEFMDTGDILASVKKGFVEFIDFITLGAFGKDSIGKLFDDVINFLAPIAETVGNFIDGIGNFFNDKFQKLKKFFGISREKTPAESEPIQVKTPIELLNEQIATLKAKRDSLVTLNEAKKAKVEELRAQKRKKQEEKIAELKAIPGKIKDKIFEVGKKVVSKVSATVSPTASTPAAPVSPVASSPAPEPITGGAKEEPGQQGGGSLAQLVKVDTGVDISKFNPALEEAVVRMADAFKKETGKRLLITSGYRSNEKQKQLWDAELAKNGGDAAKARKMVAPPAPPLGTGKGSPHLRGLAIDINSRGADGINALAGTRENPTGWLEKFGLARPVPNENWHVQLAKTPPVGDSNTAVNDNGKVVNLATGKQEVGEKVAKNSVELAQNQREQEKRQTPTVINAGITNNNTNVRNTSRAEAKAA